MKHLLVTLALSLLAAGICLAQTVESEKHRQEMEAKRQAEEARQRDAQRTLERAQQDLQPPILREPPYPSDPGKPTPPSVSSGRMLAEAAELERSGNGPEAVKMYMGAARERNGKAALRLAQIYEKGIPGVARNYQESIRWYGVARALGEKPPPIVDPLPPSGPPRPQFP
jgi:TPR repeat protein